MAARRVAWGTFVNSGQTCLRPDYLLVHEDVAERFYKKLERVVKDFYTSDPQKTEFFGRVINARAHKRLSKLVEDSRSRIRFGGVLDESDKVFLSLSSSFVFGFFLITLLFLVCFTYFDRLWD